MARADIQADIDLDSSGFRKGINKAKSSVNNFVSSAIKRFGALAGAAGMGALTRSAINLGSYLSDVAESTGFATEQFQVFRGALIDAGGNAESMEKAILLMQKAVVQGSEGLTTYKRAFERLGLSVDQLKSMRPEQQFEMIAKSIASAEDQQEALTAAIEIFGQRNAPRLIEVFKRLDKDGYGKMAKDIEKAYGVMDKETQQKLDAAADRIERFKNKVTIMTGTVLTYVVPSFTILKEGLGGVGDIVGSLIGKFSSLLGFMARSVKVTIDPVVKQFQSLAMGIKGVTLSLTNPIQAAKAFADSLALQGESVQSLLDVPSKLAQEYARANEEMEIDSAHLEQSMIERSENITNAWDDMWSDNVQAAKDANAEIVANTGAAVAEIKEETAEDDKPAATTTAAERATTTTAAAQDGIGRYGDPLFGQSTLGQYLFGKDRFGATPTPEGATTTTAAAQDGMDRYRDPLFGQSTLGQHLFSKDRFGVTPTPAIGAAPTQEVAAGGKKKQEIIFTQMRDSLKEIEQEMTR